MGQSSITTEQKQEVLAAMKKADGVQTVAAKLLGMPPSTFRNRLLAATTDPVKECVEADERVELRDKIRTLTAQINSFNREVLDDKYVKEKIMGLVDSPIDPPVWLSSPTRSKHAPGVPTLFASDWHHGERVFPNQVGGVNEFNMEIAHRRAKRLITGAIDLLTNHMVNPKYPGIVFALGGDMVSGGIHEELMATDEMEIMPVVIDLIGILVWCIDTLIATFGKVFVPCVTGNHGRNTQKIRAKGRNFTSFDWLTYQMLAMHYKDEPRVVFSIPDGPDCLYQVYNRRYLLTHGDQFRGGDGLIGHLGPVFRGNHKKSSRNIQIGMEYDTMMIGHFHTLAQLPRIITNGSLKGYDEYAYSNNFSYELPQQALWITHPTRGITFSMPVHLEDSKHNTDADWVNWKGKK